MVIVIIGSIAREQNLYKQRAPFLVPPSPRRTLDQLLHKCDIANLI